MSRQCHEVSSGFISISVRLLFFLLRAIPSHLEFQCTGLRLPRKVDMICTSTSHQSLGDQVKGELFLQLFP